jgi:endonuclease G
MTPNYAIASRYGKAAQSETFLMSNVCPQRAELNEQTWQYLESVVANEYSRDFDDLWVIAGPILDKGCERLNGIAAVPKAFYMIIVGKDDDSPDLHMLAVIIDQKVKGNQVLRKFVTTVRDVERKTGLNFFSELPQETQDKLETVKADDELWGLDRMLGAALKN